MAFLQRCLGAEVIQEFWVAVIKLLVNPPAHHRIEGFSTQRVIAAGSNHIEGIIVIGFQHRNIQRAATEVEHSDALSRFQGFCSGIVVRGSLRLGNGGDFRCRQAQLGRGIQQNLNLVGRPRLWVGEHQFGRLHVAMFAGHALHYGGQHRSNRHGGGQIIAVDLEHLLRDHALGCRNETRRVGLGLVHSDVANVDLLR